jgi:hypothetical protein
VLLPNNPDQHLVSALAVKLAVETPLPGATVGATDCDSAWLACTHPIGMLSDATYSSDLTLTTRLVLGGRAK